MRWTLLALLGCSADVPDSPVESAPPDVDAMAVSVLVRLDGEPSPDTVVLQPGRPDRWRTGPRGEVDLTVDFTIPGGEAWVVASHPEARIGGTRVRPGDAPRIVVDLVRYGPDNPDYTFKDPGEPDRRDTTAQCGHCHVTLNRDWAGSVHRTAASNPVVHDVYAGTGRFDEADCPGVWGTGVGPGTGAAAARCYVGDGGLQAWNPGCGPICDTTATVFGGCADCHAPGIDGDPGGRDLLTATGFAYDYGVHCDVCHRVDEVVLSAEAGVAGRLRITRPSEPEVEGWLPLTFGPFHDVPTSAMGAVQRDHFLDGSLCAGCHQLLQPALVPGLDPVRWPDGTLPVHTTYDEWRTGPYAPSTPCNHCHMPPATDVGNAADLYNAFDLDPGWVAGWERPPGEVRHHSWVGPRSPASPLLRTAARLDLQTTVDGGVLTVDVTVTNVGAGHAIPTGEPLRTLVLLVEATCDGVPLPATGGDAVPWFGGGVAGTVDQATWPGARVGDVVRVVARPGGYRDYVGPGPFGDGTFDAAAKGLPVQTVVGARTIVAVDAGVVTFDAPLPAGDVAFLGHGGPLPTDGAPMTDRAGAPGFAFARITADPAGARVHHALATDVSIDDRILPLASVTTHHTFAATCADPETRAVLVHRAWPRALAAERGWAATETVMAEVHDTSP